jgi:hypothetical protein
MSDSYLKNNLKVIENEKSSYVIKSENLKELVINFEYWTY